jgi:hypothetical protein
MIPQSILDRLVHSQLSGLRVGELFTNLAVALDQAAVSGGVLSLEFITPGDALQAGDLIPSIQLTLKRVADAPAPEETQEERPCETGGDTTSCRGCCCK